MELGAALIFFFINVFGLINFKGRLVAERDSDLQENLQISISIFRNAAGIKPTELISLIEPCE